MQRGSVRASPTAWIRWIIVITAAWLTQLVVRAPVSLLKVFWNANIYVGHTMLVFVKFSISDYHHVSAYHRRYVDPNASDRSATARDFRWFALLSYWVAFFVDI